VPFSRHNWGIAGEDIETPGLLAEAEDGCNDAGKELDNLFAAEEARRQIGEESQVPAGLRPIGQNIYTRFGKA
jgi:hypothetical protein